MIPSNERHEERHRRRTCIVIGGIDLSVGLILAFVMMVMGWLKETFNVPLPLAILIALLCGAVCGWLTHGRPER